MPRKHYRPVARSTEPAGTERSRWPFFEVAYWLPLL